MRPLLHVLFVLGLMSPSTSLLSGNCLQRNNRTQVRCSFSQLTEVPSDISFESSIRWLDLSTNNISALSSTSFRWTNDSASSLQHLNLCNNLIDTIEGDPFEPLTELQYLNLNLNFITRLPAHLFAHNKNLRTLLIHRNARLHLPVSGFDLPRLSVLDLGHCGLKHIPVDFFARMKALVTLILDHNQLSRLEPTVFSHLRHLSRLSLQHNRLVSLTALLIVPVSTLVSVAHNPWPCDCQLASQFHRFAQGREQQALNCHDHHSLRVLNPDTYLDICRPQVNMTALLAGLGGAALLVLAALLVALVKPVRHAVANCLAQGCHYVRRKPLSSDHRSVTMAALIEADADVPEATPERVVQEMRDVSVDFDKLSGVGSEH